jgi:hypothetical protein
MSKIALSGNSLGTGTLTISAPNTNVDRVLDLPDAAGDFVLNTATQTLTNKTLTSPTLTTPNINSAQVATVSGTAPIFMCRAWVNFNGTGTVAIRASGNVSSITDNGTGNYTVNFTTAMPDANYAVCGTPDNSGGGNPVFLRTLDGTTVRTTSAVTIQSLNFSGSSTDAGIVQLSIFR